MTTCETNQPQSKQACPTCKKTVTESLVFNCLFLTMAKTKIYRVFQNEQPRGQPGFKYFIRAFYCQQCDQVVAYAQGYDEKTKRITDVVVSEKPLRYTEQSAIDSFKETFLRDAGVEQR